jgi:hypothetical protein
MGEVKSPDHQRQAIIDYFLAESPEGTEVHHAEKVASERIYGIKHDVWDVSSTDGRWWVITNPTNLYPQETVTTPSMDHAFSMHIGVTARLVARQDLEAPVDGPVREFVSKAWRKFEQTAEALEVADEAEDFQAVGMRLRECLITFAQETSERATVPEGSEAPQKSNFKGWAELLAQAAAPDPRGKQMRSYLRTMARETWDLVARLTHAANATRSDGNTALDAVSHLMQVYSLALIRQERGEPIRCAICASYQVTMDYRNDEGGMTRFLRCEACGAEAEQPGQAATT